MALQTLKTAVAVSVVNVWVTPLHCSAEFHQVIAKFGALMHLRLHLHTYFRNREKQSGRLPSAPGNISYICG